MSILSAEDYIDIDRELQSADDLLDTLYRGADSARHPVHTVYVPADVYQPGIASAWGEQARDAMVAFGGSLGLCEALGIGELSEQIAALVDAKLAREPIEDLRIDFEDGYGTRGDDIEDADSTAAAQSVALAVRSASAPPFVGIRIKSLEARTRRRGLSTLDRFLTVLADAGGAPEHFLLTLPKVTSAAQVECMASVCDRIEQRLGMRRGWVRLEVQVESPQLIIGPDGTSPLAKVVHSPYNRVSALHYGTYDYSAALGIAAEHQSLAHPAADFAKQVMQVVVADTGVRLSDGSTNVIPIGESDQVLRAWRLHASLVERGLERGYYQGWDLHPAQLPTRYISNYAFYLRGLPAAVQRLDDYSRHVERGISDEPATARALARFIQRGLKCGAVDAEELDTTLTISLDELNKLANPTTVPRERA